MYWYKLSELRMLYYFLTLRVWLWQALPGHEVHDGGLAVGQPQRRQGHVPVQEAALVDQAEDLGAAHGLVAPVWKGQRKQRLIYTSKFHVIT